MKLVLPSNVTFAGAVSDTTTLQGNEVVLTLGRLAAGTEQTVTISTTVTSMGRHGGDDRSEVFAVVTSCTALPVFSNRVETENRH